jgi:hypothetical protein
MEHRFLGWWRLAEQMASSLTRPRIDLARADAEIYEVVTHSRLFAGGAVAAAALRRAWIDSRVRTWIGQVGDAASGSPAERIRFVSRCTLVAVVTILVLLAAGTSGGRGYQVIVPIVAGVAALGAGRYADALARAWFDKRA